MQVLRNKLGLTRRPDMDRAEYEALLRAQQSILSEIGSDTRFTAARLRRMHRDWLGDIYEWAGEYRTVNVSKGGFTWPGALTIPNNMENFERGLLAGHTPCEPGPLREVAGRIARVHADLLLIHPFREGNGRLARWLAELMAYQAGLPSPNYPLVGPDSKARFNRYVNAVASGYIQDYDLLTDFFVEAFRAGLQDESQS